MCISKPIHLGVQGSGRQCRRGENFFRRDTCYTRGAEPLVVVDQSEKNDEEVKKSDKKKLLDDLRQLLELVFLLGGMLPSLIVLK